MRKAKISKKESFVTVIFIITFVTICLIAIYDWGGSYLISISFFCSFGFHDQYFKANPPLLRALYHFSFFHSLLSTVFCCSKKREMVRFPE